MRGLVHECARQTDGQTDRTTFSNSALYQRLYIRVLKWHLPGRRAH